MHGEITAPEKVQPIDRQRNLHSGMNLNKFHRLRFDFPEPPGKFGSMYMSREAVDRLIARMRNESAFYNYIYDSEPYFRPMLFMLQDTTGAKIHEAATLVEKKAHDVLDFLVNAYGIQDKHVHYYEGVFNVVNFFYMADQVLASPLATEEDKAKARKGIALFASIWTDDNHTPGQEDTGLNYGTANMPLTFGAFRDMFIVYLAGDPAYTARAKQVAARLGHNLTTQINEHGAHMGGMHYIEASFSALVSNMLLLRQAGIADFFADDAKHGSRLTKFAEFMMHALTPPDPRFGNIRKMIATGDGSYESADRYGVLATGFAQANPALSARLMGAWTQNGRHHAAMFGSSVMKVDDELPAKDPALGSATFPGYYSVLRAGWGTPHETAVWFINGDWYRDHKHPGDGGEVIIYALSAPLSLDFGSMYSPHAPGAEYHSVVHPGGQAPKVEAFDANARGGMSRATFDLPNNGKWTRAVSLGLLTDDLPVIAIQDTIAGGGDRTWQLNLMTDELRTAEGPRAVGQPFTLPAGITALEMTGQRWAKHAAQGIDGMLYLVTPTPRPVEIAAWKHNWHPATEQYQFQRANERGFEERQLLLRVKGDGSLRAILVPYYKGQKPTDLKVMLEGDQVIVSAGGKSLRLTQDGRMQTPH
ncbi:MAG: hypothetical protein BWY76_00012 [bacterium ADurb.Bin429]|nr:MAG: hypothetical protein BWY76_00012 [bacterium ADurb.Bin429]